MKAIILLVVLVGAVFLVIQLTSSSIDESFDPAQQGRETRAIVKECASWTEVLERAGAPSFWRPDTSDFDFVYTDRFEEGTRDKIAQQMERNQVPYGFSFLYKYGAVTFAVNFDRNGNLSNIQDKESQADLLGMDDD